jgi:AcrR family transcriptional regulator
MQAPDHDTSSRHRILAATAEVLGRNGMTKLSLSEVALQAGVSRPTLYRYFAGKRELLDAFVVWERQFYERAIAEATADIPACERLDAALRVIVEYQQSYRGCG